MTMLALPGTSMVNQWCYVPSLDIPWLCMVLFCSRYWCGGCVQSMCISWDRLSCKWWWRSGLPSGWIGKQVYLFNTFICCPLCNVFLVEQVAEVDIAGMPANVDVDLNAECGESGTAQFVELPHSRFVMLRAAYVLLTIASDWTRVHVSVFGLIGLILMNWKCMKPMEHCV